MPYQLEDNSNYCCLLGEQMLCFHNVFGHVPALNIYLLTSTHITVEALIFAGESFHDCQVNHKKNKN